MSIVELENNKGLPRPILPASSIQWEDEIDKLFARPLHSPFVGIEYAGTRQSILNTYRLARRHQPGTAATNNNENSHSQPDR